MNTDEPKCCGAVRTTPFCPNCGKRVPFDPLAWLLDEAGEVARQLLADGDGGGKGVRYAAARDALAALLAPRMDTGRPLTDPAFGLPGRVANALAAGGVRTVADAVRLRPGQVASVPRVGPLGVNALRARLAALGLSLKDDSPGAEYQEEPLGDKPAKERKKRVRKPRGGPAGNGATGEMASVAIGGTPGFGNTPTLFGGETVPGGTSDVP